MSQQRTFGMPFLVVIIEHDMAKVTYHALHDDIREALDAYRTIADNTTIGNLKKASVTYLPDDKLIAESRDIESYNYGKMSGYYRESRQYLIPRQF